MAFVIDLGGATATTPFEANDPAHFQARVAGILDFFINGSLPTDANGEIWGEDNAINALARLAAASNPISTLTARVSAANGAQLVNDGLYRTQVHGLPGTDFNEVGISRPGDWDMTVKSLVTLMYRYGHKLQRTVYVHVLYTLLDIRGRRPAFSDWLIPPLPILETENHVLMIETSRYLTNQLLYLDRWAGEAPPNEELEPSEFDNELNGMNEWMLEHLSSFLRWDFNEYNSRPYQRLSVTVLQNLYDLAWNERVKLAARMVLDYVSAKTAVSSNGLRRVPPYRRLTAHISDTALFGPQNDAETSRMLMLSGLTSFLPTQSERPGAGPGRFADDYAADALLHAALTSYRVPEIVLDVLMDKHHNIYQQQFCHGFPPHPLPGFGFAYGGVEIYASAPEFLLTAGGVWLQVAQEFTLGVELVPPIPIAIFEKTILFGDHDDASVLPSTLMPSRGGSDRSDFIRIDGRQSPGGPPYPIDDDLPPAYRRTNTGVVAGFACGLNVFVPDSYLGHGCSEQVGNWLFVNAGGTCVDPHNSLGFYVAVYQQKCDTAECRETVPNGDYGYDSEVTFDTALTFGFFEVAAADAMDFQTFKSTVLRRNEWRTFTSEGVNEYHASDDRHILFTPNPPDRFTWGISSIDGRTQETDIRQWPLARGDIINSPGGNGHTGLVTIDNPYHQKRLVLDMTDPTIPRRYQFSLSSPRQSAGALVGRDVYRLDAFWVAPDGTVNTIASDRYANGGAWNFPAALSPPHWARRSSELAPSSPIVSVARTSERTDVFWFDPDDEIRSCRWDANVAGGIWTHPFVIHRNPRKVGQPGEQRGKASQSSGLAAVARTPDNINLFWISKDGAVWTQWWALQDGGTWQPFGTTIAQSGMASVKSNVSAIARSADLIDVFWVATDGRIWTNAWNGAWHKNPWPVVDTPGAAEPSSALSVNARRENQIDVFWIGPDGAVHDAWWSDSVPKGNWLEHPAGTITQPHTAARSSRGLASISRLPGLVDIFWITPDGAIHSSFWNDQWPAAGWATPFEVAPAGSALTDAGAQLHVASRSPDNLDLIWAGPDAQLWTQSWAPLEGIAAWDLIRARPITAPHTVDTREALTRLHDPRPI